MEFQNSKSNLLQIKENSQLRFNYSDHQDFNSSMWDHSYTDACYLYVQSLILKNCPEEEIVTALGTQPVTALPTRPVTVLELLEYCDPDNIKSLIPLEYAFLDTTPCPLPVLWVPGVTAAKRNTLPGKLNGNACKLKTTKKKCFKCSHEDCEQFYKSAAGLRYHIKTCHFQQRNVKCIL